MSEEAGRIVARLDELCEGESESEFDAWLRERLYPIVAMFSRLRA